MDVVEHFRRRFERIDMQRYESGLNRSLVAASQNEAYGQLVLTTELEHEPVTLVELFCGHLQRSQRIVLMRICSRLVKNKVRLPFCDDVKAA